MVDTATEYFVFAAGKHALVLRSIFISKPQYIDFLRRWRFEESLIVRLLRDLPDTFWMIEISCPDLFSSTRGKFGEVLLTYEIANENSGGSIKPLFLPTDSVGEPKFMV